MPQVPIINTYSKMSEQDEGSAELTLKAAVKQIAEGDYGFLWTTSAKMAVKGGSEEDFAKMIQDQLKDPESEGKTREMFSEEIIKALS